MKKSVLVTLDSNVWLHFRMKDFNISGHVNDILKLQMSLEADDRGLKELEEKLNELKTQQKELEEESIKIQAQILHRKAEFEKQAKEEFERALVIDDTIKASGRLKDLI